MQVIFIQDVKKQGKKGEIKEVKTGYAENYLIKNGYAIPVNKENLRELNFANQRKQKQDNNKRKEAEELKKELEKQTLEFIVKTGKNDQVFGSISTKQIKEELNKKGYKIDKKQIELQNNIMSLGFHNIKITLYDKINAIVKIHVKK